MVIKGDTCTWWLNSKLCHGRKQDSAGWEGIPVYDCCREEAVFIIAGRGGDLFIFGFRAVKWIPFKEESADLYPLNTKEVVDSCINKTSGYDKDTSSWSEAIWKACKGHGRYSDAFFASLNESVKKNMLPLFRLKAKSNQSSAKN